ncbi:mRNA binding protein puf3, partial [Dimargaris verticillata]
RIFEYCPEEFIRPLLDELHKYTSSLVQDQYGNYVIQHVLEHSQKADRDLVVSKVRGNVLILSKHKFASNVVERCITYGSEEQRRTLVEEVIQTRPDGTTALSIMMKDQYANYVVQKMLDAVEGNLRDLLVLKIRPHIQSLKKYTYGKHLITKIEKLVPQMAAMATSPGISGMQPSPVTPVSALPSPSLGLSAQPTPTLPSACPLDPRHQAAGEPAYGSLVSQYDSPTALAHHRSSDVSFSACLQPSLHAGMSSPPEFSAGSNA